MVGIDSLERVSESVAALPYPLDSRSNDGIVPTLNQIHGRVIDIVVADHLDIVGQFRRDDLPMATGFFQARISIGLVSRQRGTG